ncbi:hypothetical protein FGB62_30g13 [Gracilaria domingensis]|nr:hypothetical protein FGB62_30g13 [Gracilaria domingensis]
MVVTISPNLSLYRIVVFPAASSPTCSAFATRGEMAHRTDRRSVTRADEWGWGEAARTYHKDTHLLLAQKAGEEREDIAHDESARRGKRRSGGDGGAAKAERGAHQERRGWEQSRRVLGVAAAQNAQRTQL